MSVQSRKRITYNLQQGDGFISSLAPLMSKAGMNVLGAVIPELGNLAGKKISKKIRGDGYALAGNGYNLPGDGLNLEATSSLQKGYKKQPRSRVKIGSGLELAGKKKCSC